MNFAKRHLTIRPVATGLVRKAMPHVGVMMAVFLDSTPLRADPLPFTQTLDMLTSYRERPLFAPSRRPVAPPVVEESMPEVVAAEPLKATLLGVISSSEGEGLALLKIESEPDVSRVRIGETIQGWQLESLQSHAATFSNAGQKITLAFPEAKADQGETVPDGSPPVPKEAGQSPLLPDAILNP